MLDTLVQSHHVYLPAIERSPFWLYHTGRLCSELRYQYYTYSIKALHTKINFKYFPNNRYTGTPVLINEVCSAPKLIFGNNFQLATDLSLIIQTINSYIQLAPCLENIDSAKGLLERIDLCDIFQVGENLPYYLRAFENVNCTSRNVISYTNRRCLPHAIDKRKHKGEINGVLIGCKSISTSFYDKYKECLDDRAKGILRMETRIKGNSLIGSKIGIPQPKLEDITPERVAAVLETELDFLGLAGDFLSEENVLSQLVEKVGAKQAKSLYAILSVLTLHQGKSVKELSEILEVTQGTISVWKNKLETAGISLGMSPSTTKLPRLVPGFQVESQKNHNKFLSDTGEAVDPLTEQEVDALKVKLQSITGRTQIQAAEVVDIKGDQIIEPTRDFQPNGVNNTNMASEHLRNLNSWVTSWIFQLNPEVSVISNHGYISLVLSDKSTTLLSNNIDLSGTTYGVTFRTKAERTNHLITGTYSADSVWPSFPQDPYTDRYPYELANKKIEFMDRTHLPRGQLPLGINGYLFVSQEHERSPSSQTSGRIDLLEVIAME